MWIRKDLLTSQYLHREGKPAGKREAGRPRLSAARRRSPCCVQGTPLLGLRVLPFTRTQTREDTADPTSRPSRLGSTLQCCSLSTHKGNLLQQSLLGNKSVTIKQWNMRKTRLRQASFLGLLHFSGCQGRSGHLCPVASLMRKTSSQRWKRVTKDKTEPTERHCALCRDTLSAHQDPH